MPSNASPPVPVSASDSVPLPVRSAAAWSWRLLLIGAGIAALAWITRALEVIVVPIAVAMLLTVLLTPVRRFLERRAHLGRGAASGVALLALLLVVVGLIAVAGGSIASGAQDLYDEAVKGFETFTTWLNDGPLGIDAERLASALESGKEALAANQDRLVSGALGAATTVGHVAAGTLITLFCTYFFLYDGRTIWAWLVGLLPHPARDRVHQAGRRGIVTLAAYARTQVLVAGVDAVGIGLGAAILRVPLALPLAILVFVGSFIPIVGAVLTGSVAILVALVATGNWVTALIMLGVVLLVQQLEGHVLQPFLMGHAVSLHPVAVLLVVATGSFVAGIVGALFAVPLAAALNTATLYLHGHDKFPELGSGDPLIIRGKPVVPAGAARVPVVVAEAEADLADAAPGREGAE